MPTKGTYKKRTYKKRTYKRRYRKRYYKRRFYRKSTIKKPEINILSVQTNNFTVSTANGQLFPMTAISADAVNDSDKMIFKIGGAGEKVIQGRKIRLKYLYIKGYMYSNDANDDNINAKIYVFRQKQNIGNQDLKWSDMLDMPFGLDTPTSWTTDNINDILYRYDWKNDNKGKLKHYVRNLYKSYDNTNNIIPFKIRIPLYDCVLTCDNYYDTNESGANKWKASNNPSTNAIWFSFITNKGISDSHYLKMKYKLYYTDY